MFGKIGLAMAVAGAACAWAQTAPRCNATQNGSVLIFPKVELRWDASGELVQDSFISLNNAYNLDGVRVLMIFVCETGEHMLAAFSLSANEGTFWSASTGLPKGVPAITGARDPYPDPEGSGDLVLRGTVAFVATEELRKPVRWNYLSGAVTILHYERVFAWEYGPYAFRVADPNVPHGDVVDAAVDAGTQTAQLELDGVVYENAYGILLLNFMTSGSTGLSGGSHVLTSDTELTLMAAKLDVRQETPGWPMTKALFFIWNEDETSFSSRYCVAGWSQRLLCTVPLFSITYLQTNAARAEIEGVNSQECDDPLAVPPVISTTEALLGVAARVQIFDTGQIAYAGGPLYGAGTEAGQIRYDLLVPSPENNTPREGPARAIRRRVLPGG